MEEILRTLLSFPTVTGDQQATQAAMHYVATYVQARGMYVEHFVSNGFPSLVATTKPQRLTPEVLFMAHLDVVPAKEQLFALRVEGDKYFGRGAYDMKSGLAAFLQTIDDLGDDLAQYDLGLMVTSDEEVGGRNGAQYLLEQGYRPKVCVIPDGGDNWQLETFEKGVQWIKLEATGVAAHASRPWEGEHAVHKLLAALADIRGAFPATAGKKETLLSVGTIKGGETANQTAEYAEAMLDIRTGSLEDHQRSFPAIEKMCQAHDVRAALLVSDPPCSNDLTNPYIHAFRTILTDTLGWQPGTKYSYAVNDGRFFSAVGVPCVIVMPPGGGWHSDDEWVSAQGCEQYCQMLRRYVDAVARTPQNRTGTPLAARPNAVSSRGA